jgi:nucleotide-binding universal stress UspA family protein
MTVYRVLLATDGSDHALRAAEHVHSMLAHLGVKVTLLYVLQPPEAVLPAAVSPGAAMPLMGAAPPERNDHELAAQILEQTRHVLCMDLAQVELLTREGHPDREIVAEAKEGKYDLVVVGCRGHKGWKGVLMGSVSAKVVAEAPCPVLVVK